MSILFLFYWLNIELYFVFIKAHSNAPRRVRTSSSNEAIAFEIGRSLMFSELTAENPGSARHSG